MEIMCVARLTRPDVLLAKAYLATKAQHPKEGDYKAALRIISYLKGAPSHGIVINCRVLKFHLHCDASILKVRNSAWGPHHLQMQKLSLQRWFENFKMFRQSYLEN